MSPPPEHENGPLPIFHHAVNRSLQTGPLESDKSSGCWLAALVYTQAMIQAIAFDDVTDSELSYDDMSGKIVEESIYVVQDSARRLTTLHASWLTALTVSPIFEIVARN